MTDISVHSCHDGAVEILVEQSTSWYRVTLDPEDARRLRDMLDEALREVGA